MRLLYNKMCGRRMALNVRMRILPVPAAVKRRPKTITKVVGRGYFAAPHCLYFGGDIMYKIEEITEKIKPIARNYKIEKVYLFGSYARGEAAEESDIDLIVDAENLKGLKFFGFYDDLSEAFQRKVDLITQAQIERNRDNPLYEKFIEEVEADRTVVYSK